MLTAAETQLQQWLWGTGRAILQKTEGTTYN